MKRKCKQWWSTSPPICTNNHLWPQLNEHWKRKRPWNDVYDALYIFAMYHHIYANYGKPMWPCFVPEKIISDIQFLQTCLSFKQNKMMFWPIVTVVFNIFLIWKCLGQLGTMTASLILIWSKVLTLWTTLMTTLVSVARSANLDLKSNTTFERSPSQESKHFW